MPYVIKLLPPKSKRKATVHGHALFMLEKTGKMSTFATVGAARKAAKAWQLMHPRGAYAIMKVPLKAKKGSKRGWLNLQKKVW